MPAVVTALRCWPLWRVRLLGVRLLPLLLALLALASCSLVMHSRSRQPQRLHITAERGNVKTLAAAAATVRAGTGGWSSTESAAWGGGAGAQPPATIPAHAYQHPEAAAAAAVGGWPKTTAAADSGPDVSAPPQPGGGLRLLVAVPTVPRPGAHGPHT